MEGQIQEVTMKEISGSTRKAFLVYFLSHVPITLLIDSQGLLGPYYPKFLTDVVAWYCGLFGDILMKNAPSTEYAWFSSLICCEILFQLPFFFVAIKFIMAGGCYSSANESSDAKKRDYPEWFRMACIIYGVHVSVRSI